MVNLRASPIRRRHLSEIKLRFWEFCGKILIDLSWRDVDMLENVNVFCHNSIKIEGSKTIYIDPYNIKEAMHDADYIFSTHTHYDHFSEDDIEMLLKEDTVIITPDSSRELACDLTKDRNRVVIVEPENGRRCDD